MGFDQKLGKVGDALATRKLGKFDPCPYLFPKGLWGVHSLKKVEPFDL